MSDLQVSCYFGLIFMANFYEWCDFAYQWGIKSFQWIQIMPPLLHIPVHGHSVPIIHIMYIHGPCFPNVGEGTWFVNSLQPIDAIWWHKSGWSILAQVMAWWLMAPSHHLNQCGLIISTLPWYSSEGIYFQKKISFASRWCDTPVTWFCHQLIAKSGNKTAEPQWPDSYEDTSR